MHGVVLDVRPRARPRREPHHLAACIPVAKDVRRNPREERADGLEILKPMIVEFRRRALRYPALEDA